MLIWIVGIVSSLGLVGAIAACVVAPAVAIPLLSSVTGAVLKCKPCMAVLAAIALLFTGSLYGVHVESAKCEARIEKMRQAAEAARVDRDAEVRADLEQTFKPQITTLAGERDALEEKVKQYAQRKPVSTSPAARACKLGDAAGLLQPSKPR